MAPYFETVRSFADVSVTDSGVDTVQFLEASDGLIKLFDLLGAGVFSFVQADMRTNIRGVRECHSSHPEACVTLEKLVESEACVHGKPGTGCLRRLLRGLTLTCRALQSSRANDSEELQTSFRRAYDAVLKRHHNLAIRTMVIVALKACPWRRDFYARIAQGEPEEKLNDELGKWLDGLDGIIKRMMAYYEKGGHGCI